MSDFIKGDLIILYVWDEVDTYDPIACLTSNGLSQAATVIEAQTKCEPGQVLKASGSLNNEITFEGNYIDTTSAGSEITKASHDKIMLLINTGALVTWKMDTGLTDTVAYYGEGLFSDLEMTAPAGDEFVTFSGTLSVSGAIVTVDPNL